MNKELFKRLYKVSFNQSNAFWQTTTNFSIRASLNHCLYHVETEFVETQGNIELLQQRATAAIEDLIGLKATIPGAITVLEFLQFLFSSLVLRHVTNQKVFVYSFDWVINAVDDKVSSQKQRQINIAQLDRFIQSQDQFIRQHFFYTLFGWANDLFYYSRSTGGHKDVCALFNQHYLQYFIQMVRSTTDNDGIRALTQIMTWCHQFEFKTEERLIAETLYSIYQDTENNETRKIIAFQFCVGDLSFSPITKIEWCEIVKNDFGGELRQHERLQILVNTYEHDIEKLLQHFDEILEAIYTYKNGLSQQSAHQMGKYNSNRIYTIMERSILMLIRNGYVGKANQLIGAFFNVLEDELITSSICYIIPNDPEGVLYCFPSDVQRKQSETIKNIPLIISGLNDFLGIANALQDDMAFQLAAQPREGVPNEVEANDCATAIADHFDFRTMRFSPQFQNCTGYHLIYGSQLPLQNIMANQIGVTIPIVHSFKKTLPARTLKKVFIWQGDALLAEYERTGLQEIFTSFGIGVEFKAHHASDEQELLKCYSDPAYDIIWLICHGQFFHYESHKSYLDLGSGIILRMDQVPALHPDDKRRLLIIDACDGATTSLGNTPDSIGIGPVVINGQQSLLSHSWPVDNHSSMILGFLVAVFLCKGKTYATAHYNAICIFQKGKQVVIELLSQYITNQDIIDRIQNKQLDYQNFIYWGSLVYME